MRKQQRMDEMIGEVSWIQEENKKLSQKIEATTQLHLNIASNNNVLRAQLAELTDRLSSLNSVLQIASEASGLVVEILDSFCPCICWYVPELKWWWREFFMVSFDAFSFGFIS